MVIFSKTCEINFERALSECKTVHDEIINLQSGSIEKEIKRIQKIQSDYNDLIGLLRSVNPRGKQNGNCYKKE